MKTESEQRLAALLCRLPDALDERRHAEITQRHCRALRWEAVDRLPLVISYPLAEDGEFKPYPHREIFDDPAKMLFNEVVSAFETSIARHACVGDDLAWTVRANFGTVVIASLFGARIEQVGDNPPWVRSDESSPRPVKSILDCAPTDFSRGWCARVIQRCEFFRAVLAQHPVLRRAIRIVLPDLQGPFDTLELILGSAVFTELYDHPEDVAAALRVLAVAQVEFARRLLPLVSDGPDGFSHQHATMIRGRILIRDDTAILVSPDTFRQLIAPPDVFVLRELGGGGIHCCGVVERHAPAFLDVPGLQCFDFGQAELNDVDAVYRLAQAKRIPLIRVWASEEELLNGQILKRFPTGVSLRHRARSLADARRIMDGYRRATDQRR